MKNYEFEVTFDQLTVEADNPTEAIDLIKKLIAEGFHNILVREVEAE